MEDILDHLQEACYGLADLREGVACGSVTTAHLTGFLANVRHMLADAGVELDAIEAHVEPTAA